MNLTLLKVLVVAAEIFFRKAEPAETDAIVGLVNRAFAWRVFLSSSMQGTSFLRLDCRAPWLERRHLAPTCS
jgi:hypothetical protein